VTQDENKQNTAQKNQKDEQHGHYQKLGVNMGINWALFFTS
jgi:hypothetical protein